MMTAILKSKKLQYFRSYLASFDEMLHGNAYLAAMLKTINPVSQKKLDDFNIILKKTTCYLPNISILDGKRR